VKLFPNRFFKNTEISNFMKICPVGAMLFHADRWTGRQAGGQARSHNKANSRFLQFCELA
jgi:hypothetical protein